jgi:hypothetical protein
MQTAEWDPNKVMQEIGTTTYRNAFEYGLDYEVSRGNMEAWCEEFFDMEDSNDVWSFIDVCIKQVKQTRKALA